MGALAYGNRPVEVRLLALITAVVCTRNRCGLLQHAIDSLVTQSLAREKYEILVVDNGSTDQTGELVRDRARQLGNLHYTFEAKSGLSNARNAGLERAQTPLVAFMDDDAMASPRWLEAICEVFKHRHPQPGVVCGPVQPEWGAPRPQWLTDNWLPFYSVINWSMEARCLGADEWVVGANFAVPRYLAMKCGGFDTSLGRQGTVLLSDEEFAFTEQLRHAGYEIFYDPAVSVNHYIHPERLSRRWFFRRVFWGAVSHSTLEREAMPDRKCRYRCAAKAALGVLRNATSLHQFIEGEAERVFRYQQIAEKLGQMRGLLFGSVRLL